MKRANELEKKINIKKCTKGKRKDHIMYYNIYRSGVHVQVSHCVY